MHFRINQGQAEVVRRLPDDNRDRHGFLFLLPNANVDSRLRLEVKAILPRDEEMSFLPSRRGTFAGKFIPLCTSTSTLAPFSRLGYTGRGTLLCGFGYRFERMGLFLASSRDRHWKGHERRSLRIRLPTPKAALAPVALPTAVLRKLEMENKALARLTVGDIVSKVTLGRDGFPCPLQCDGTDGGSHSALETYEVESSCEG